VSSSSTATSLDTTNGIDARHPTMASKYGFAKQLKELRFLFCQTSEHSAATRYAPARPEPGPAAMRGRDAAPPCVCNGAG
jgi:hypothetical protein